MARYAAAPAEPYSGPLEEARRLLDLLRFGPSPDQKDVEIAVLRHQLAVLHRQVARAAVFPDRSCRAGHSGPAAQPGALGRLPRDTGEPAALAPGPCPAVMDLSSARSLCDQRSRRRGCRPRPALGPREPALGLPAHRRRVQETRCDRLGHQRAQCAAPSPAQAGATTFGTVVVRVLTSPGHRHPSVRPAPAPVLQRPQTAATRENVD